MEGEGRAAGKVVTKIHEFDTVEHVYESPSSEESSSGYQDADYVPEDEIEDEIENCPMRTRKRRSSHEEERTTIVASEPVASDPDASSLQKGRGRRHRNKLHKTIYVVEKVEIDGAPVKPEGVLAKWRNECGCIAREQCKITWPDWRNVPEAKKNLFWGQIKAHYIFPEEHLEAAKEATLKTIGKALRTFRSRLNTEYLQQGLSPLNDFGFITPNEWEEFKAQHTTEEAKVKSSKFKKLNKQNKFPHRLGPGGYKAKDKEWSKKEEEDRAAGLLDQFSGTDFRTKRWLLGRAEKSKDGQYILSDSQVTEVLEKAKELAELEKAGKFKPVQQNDQLTIALGNKEHRGRTRAVSSIAPWKQTFKDDAGIYKRCETRSDVVKGRQEDWEMQFFDFVKDNPNLIADAARQVVVPEVRLDMFMPNSAASVRQKYPIDSIKEATLCSLHCPIGRRGEHSLDAARGIAMPGDVFHNRPIPADYSKVLVIEITNDRFVDDPLDFPMPDEGIETVRGALNNIVLWESRDIHFLQRQSLTYPSPTNVPVRSLSPVLEPHPAPVLEPHPAAVPDPEKEKETEMEKEIEKEKELEKEKEPDKKRKNLKRKKSMRRRN